MLTRIGIVLAASALLAGCGETIRPATIYQGECRLFDDPGFRVRGLTTPDKRWIATTQEKGIQVCGWKRPANLPAPVVKASVAPDPGFDCATVHQVVGLFGGDVARAEAYAVAQGATPEQITAARQCLEQPQPVVAKPRTVFRSKPKPRPVSFSQRTIQPEPIAQPIVVAAPSPVTPAQAAPVPVPVAKPVPAAAKKKCKPRNYRWQYWRPKSCP